MTTQNGLNLILSGSTGTGQFVGATSPTLITPTLGVSTATSIAFSPTTGGIFGTTTNDNAAAGVVGEFISSIRMGGGSALALTTNTPADIASINLTAGDWEIQGTISLLASGANMTIASGWTSLSSASVPNIALYNFLTASAFTAWGSNAPVLRVSTAGTSTVYLTTQATFGAGTVAASGAIFARRVR